jgi:hypothetical protein
MPVVVSVVASHAILAAPGLQVFPLIPRPRVGALIVIIFYEKSRKPFLCLDKEFMLFMP